MDAEKARRRRSARAQAAEDAGTPRKLPALQRLGPFFDQLWSCRRASCMPLRDRNPTSIRKQLCFKSQLTEVSALAFAVRLFTTCDSAITRPRLARTGSQMRASSHNLVTWRKQP